MFSKNFDCKRHAAELCLLRRAARAFSVCEMQLHLQGSVEQHLGRSRLEFEPVAWGVGLVWGVHCVCLGCKPQNYVCQINMYFSTSSEPCVAWGKNSTLLRNQVSIVLKGQHVFFALGI